jgi:hypothetical protein
MAKAVKKNWKLRLNPEQLKEALSRLLDLLEVRLERRYTVENRTKIKEWIKDYTALLNLATLTQVKQRERILESFESDQLICEFLLELSIAFYSYGGDTDDFEERLVNSLVQGLSFDGVDPRLCELPQEVLISGPKANFPTRSLTDLILTFFRMTRVTEEIPLRTYLLSNRHMQMVMLLALADDLVPPSKDQSTS